MKAIIKYPGSKWKLAKQIISFFPEHHSYLEPFCGSMAVLFNKGRSNIETVNDRDNDVVNFFSWVRNDPEKLAREIYLTPYARQVYDNAFQERPRDSLKQAVNFCIRLNMGHGYKTNGIKVGWKNDIQGRENSYALNDWNSFPERIIEAAERLKQVQIENMPAEQLIPRYNYSNVLIYADPPYLLDTRNGEQYRCEMSYDDHVQLLELLLNHKGPVVLSGYENDLYDQKLKDWYREEYLAYTQGSSPRKEVLWMNFIPNQQLMLI